MSEVSRGGVRSLLADFTGDQVRRGYDVHVVGDPSLADLPGTHHSWRGGRRRPLSAPLDWLRLHRLLSRLAPDVVHLHSFFAGAFGRIRAPGGHRLPVVYQPHSWAFDAVQQRAGRAAVVTFERWAGRRGRTTLVATNCADEIAEARTVRIETSAVALGVPIDLEWFVPAGAQERAAIRTRLAMDDRTALVCLGRIVRQKGYDIVVREWERQPVPGAVLYLVGGGEPAALAALAPTQWNRSAFAVGETDDARSWLQAADLMLLPSRYEGQSVAVSEALACGLPVVAFDVNGARAAIVDGGPAAGAVVAAGDSAALLAQARRRVDEPGLRAREAVVARARAERDSSRQVVFDRVVAAYESAISTARKPGARR